MSKISTDAANFSLEKHYEDFLSEKIIQIFVNSFLKLPNILLTSCLKLNLEGTQLLYICPIAFH